MQCLGVFAVTVFKVKKKEFINKTFRLPIELVNQLETIAQNQNVSLNNLVIQCCEYAISNIEDTPVGNIREKSAKL